MSATVPAEQLASMVPFGATLGIDYDTVRADEVVASMEWSAERCTVGGVLHGGALMSLADTAGAVCAFLNLPEGADTSTIEAKTNFFRGVTEGTVTAVARPLHVGHTTIAVRTEVTDHRGRLVAHVIQTQAVLRAHERR